MAAGPTMADMNSGLYLGLGGGMSMLEPQAQSDAITSQENSDMDWHGTLGYRLNRSFSVEMERADLGQAQLNPIGSIGYKDWNVSGIYHYKNRANSQAGKRFSFYGRAGVGKIYNKSNITVERAHDIHWLAGAGVQMALSPSLSFRAEAINYDKDAKRLGLGIVYAFGKNKDSKLSFPSRSDKNKTIRTKTAVANSSTELPDTASKSQSGQPENSTSGIAKGKAESVDTPLAANAIAKSASPATALANMVKAEKTNATNEENTNKLAKAIAQAQAQAQAQAEAEAKAEAKVKSEASAIATAEKAAKIKALAKAEDKTRALAKVEKEAVALAKAEKVAKAAPVSEALDTNAKALRAIEIAKAQDQARNMLKPQNAKTDTDMPSIESASQTNKSSYTPVEFGFDSNQLGAQQIKDLQPLLDRLKKSPTATVMLTGHTDSTGTESYNIALSLRRADALKRYLLEKGVDRQVVIVRGLGEKLPIKSNAQASGRRANRRVEIEINDSMAPPA